MKGAISFPALFETSDYSVSGKQVRNISGFGIGLYLTSEIVCLHEGKIWAESELGLGSKCYVSLPKPG